MSLKTYISAFLVLISIGGFSQDLSFSQYLYLNSLVNPAASGNTGEDVKVALGYRSQWGSVSEAFSTNLISVEYTPKKSGPNRGFLSMGLIALSEKAGTSAYKSSFLRGLGAYHFKLSKDKKLSFGLEVSYNQRSFDLEGLSWDSQYNGLGFDPNLPSLENFDNTTTSFIDGGFGVEFRNENKRKLYWKSGLAVHHFYQEQSVLESGKDLLASLSQVYFTGQKTNNNFMYRFYGLVQSQNLAALTGTVGMDITYRMNYDSKFTNFSSSSAITGGTFYRYRDALIFLVAYEYKRKFRMGISYDLNVSSLIPSSNLNGGPEINLAYLGNYKTKRRKFK